MHSDHRITRRNEICRDWHLEVLRLVRSTPTSDVYLVKDSKNTYVLKHLTETGCKYEGDAPIALSHFEGSGSVLMLRYCKDAQLLEFIDGRNLQEHVAEMGDLSGIAVAAGLLEQLHKSSVNKHQTLGRLSDLFRPLHEQSGSSRLFAEGSRIAFQLMDTEQEVTLLHGDFHHENVLHSSSRGWLAIDPQPLLGDRCYDTANLFFNPDGLRDVVRRKERVAEMAHLFSEKLGLDEARIKSFAFVHGCLSACWAIQDQRDPAFRIEMARSIGGEIGLGF